MNKLMKKDLIERKIEEFWSQKAQEYLADMFPPIRYIREEHIEEIVIHKWKKFLSIKTGKGLKLTDLSTMAIVTIVAGIALGIGAEIQEIKRRFEYYPYPDLKENDNRVICLKKWFT